MINACFYDIESLSNLFTLAAFQDAKDPKDTHIDIFYLLDNEAILAAHPDWQQQALDRVYQKNLNFNGTIRFLNLKTEQAAVQLAKMFGVSDARFMNDPDAPTNYRPEFRLVCDTDPDYDPDKHPYLMGYNSYNYDTTMLAWYMNLIWSPKMQGSKTHSPQNVCLFNPDVTAADMRRFNNRLFDRYKNQMPSALSDTVDGPDYTTNAWRIRKNMLMSGRHLDVAKLNEKQAKVALKRLLGMLGYQILESDKLGENAPEVINTIEDLYDLIAYNISDVVNLKQLFYHPLYQAQFELKKGLLTTYPELVYSKAKDAYRPEISPKTVRSDRMTIDSSSAQLATKALCPYGHLKDIETVSFLYPAKPQAEQMGIPQVNVLEEAKKFFEGLYPQPELREQFYRVYRYYKTIEGKNFNDSKTYNEDYTYELPGGKMHNALPAEKLAEVPKENTCLPYFDRDGNPTSCFVLFSTGGVHGAEYNKALYEADLKVWEFAMADLEEAKRQFPDPVDLRKAKEITMPDGRVLKYSVFLKGSRKIADSEYKDLESKKPQLFKKQDGSAKTKKGAVKDKGWALNKRYVFTSACIANHEDFTSYYPNLLRRMMAFYNEGLGYDRYAEIFDLKQKYGKDMKNKAYPEAERDRYRVLREGTKLVLNSASGAADAAFENNIRVNNQIISMRIIGQLFSWRIGQAQAYEGASIPSTNTDGLYSVMDEDLNNTILARESANIGVEIEPEPLYLISKDSNNRIEVDVKTGKIISASGGTTGCRKGPNPAKALAHPALIDWALTEYLIVTAQNYKGLDMTSPFDETIGRNILLSAKNKFDPIKLLMMYQNIIASSPGSISYIYGLRDGEDEPIVLQHYNRMFIMKPGTPETMHLHTAAARAITPAMKKKRTANNERLVAIPDPTALKVLQANGEPCNYPDKDIVTKKVTNLEPEWEILIENHDLHTLPAARLQFILDNLDTEKYLHLVAHAYTENWRNKVPGVEADAESETEEAQDEE